ncbi:hypothetical protein T484DRAFT_1757991 [Baffinella frigidus]|nr:hypothetical protein T484DRAFT_1757991 [Cryptophyta sp. CCMP2293]
MPRPTFHSLCASQESISLGDLKFILRCERLRDLLSKLPANSGDSVLFAVDTYRDRFQDGEFVAVAKGSTYCAILSQINSRDDPIRIVLRLYDTDDNLKYVYFQHEFLLTTGNLIDHATGTDKPILKVGGTVGTLAEFDNVKDRFESIYEEISGNDQDNQPSMMNVDIKFTGRCCDAVNVTFPNAAIEQSYARSRLKTDVITRGRLIHPKERRSGNENGYKTRHDYHGDEDSYDTFFVNCVGTGVDVWLTPTGATIYSTYGGPERGGDWKICKDALYVQPYDAGFLETFKKNHTKSFHTADLKEILHCEKFYNDMSKLTPDLEFHWETRETVLGGSFRVATATNDNYDVVLSEFMLGAEVYDQIFQVSYRLYDKQKNLLCAFFQSPTEESVSSVALIQQRLHSGFMCTYVTFQPDDKEYRDDRQFKSIYMETSENTGNTTPDEASVIIINDDLDEAYDYYRGVKFTDESSGETCAYFLEPDLIKWWERSDNEQHWISLEKERTKLIQDCVDPFSHRGAYLEDFQFGTRQNALVLSICNSIVETFNK